MSRKKSSARPNIPQETLERARQRAAGRVDLPVEVSAASGGAVPRSRVQQIAPQMTTMEDLAAEYSYVLVDLRNMGLLAGALFAFLIILSFIF